MNLSILSGPLIGALIGYGTNWIAIKMLFRPLKPVKIGKFTLPFTPGIIPRRKEKLALAMGDMVGNNLFTIEDIQKILLSEEIENNIVENVVAVINSDETIKELLLNIVSEEKYANLREELKLVLSEKIKNGLVKAKVGDIIASEGGKIIKQKVAGSMLQMFVTDALIASIVEPLGENIEQYINENGQAKIFPIVESEISEVENKMIKDIVNQINLEELSNGIKDIYEKFILNYANLFLEKINISNVVKEKIDAMDMLELEKLILSVMKKELGAIVNLGALIGLILGSLNMII